MKQVKRKKSSMFERSEFTIFSFMSKINNKSLYWKSSKIYISTYKSSTFDKRLQLILFFIFNKLRYLNN